MNKDFTEDIKIIKLDENNRIAPDDFFDRAIVVEKKIFEIWEEIFELQEQNVNIYEKLDESRDKIDKLSEIVNKLSEKINLLYKEDNSEMPTPQDISYWTNFGHFPEKACKGCGKCKS